MKWMEHVSKEVLLKMEANGHLIRLLKGHKGGGTRKWVHIMRICRQISVDFRRENFKIVVAGETFSQQSVTQSNSSGEESI